jgi:hypothetical protein
MRSRLVRRSAQLIADFVIGSLLPDHQTAMAFATNHSIQVDDGDSARWARARDCLAERSACEASNPFAGWSLDGISIAVWNYGRTRPATPKPRR